ncbi:DUF2235 domain-containing protein [Methylobacterium gossipiicola]|uniref:Uncharacterized alpha/beta hydrolase domain n=1 Tax=Methylobacterium gossipiicola TaxID=582675 RepID=A0A1I2SQ42_9HYPH|nr:DUF2235 domain-containing protein [Methylobacterium gossipiicola]SFG53077.1 Uncharacterized alpha/beta hydrolase domain [Methylobacterium gossipiicola]
MSDAITRRIVLFLDGTWSDDNGKSPLTNIVRLREALKIGIDTHKAQTVPGDVPVEGQRLKTDRGEIEYVVSYDSGVGTGPWDWVSGGLTGIGLDAKIRQAYRFLSKHYRPGDEIHLIGFSRGAYTARSIVGYLFAAGLLKPEHCTQEREEEAWRHYRTSPVDRNCGHRHALEPFLHDGDRLRIKSLAVFDTVGALGIPSRLLLAANRRWFEFHDTRLSSIVENSFHAVAIDEHRPSFEAALWHRPKSKSVTNTHVEQVWFPGAHGDIGGGYSRWNEGEAGRQDIAFAWMRRRLVDHLGLHFADLDPNASIPALRCDPTAHLTSPIHRPWDMVDHIRSQAARAINQTRPLASYGSPTKGRGTVAVGLVANEDPIGEMIHISALALLDAAEEPTITLAWEKLSRRYPYRPPNLIAVLPLIAFTYRAWDPTAWAMWKPYADAIPRVTAEPRTLSIVGWDGQILPAQPPEASEAASEDNVFRYLGSDPAAFGLSRASTLVVSVERVLGGPERQADRYAG